MIKVEKTSKIGAVEVTDWPVESSVRGPSAGRRVVRSSPPGGRTARAVRPVRVRVPASVRIGRPRRSARCRAVDRGVSAAVRLCRAVSTGPACPPARRTAVRPPAPADAQPGGHSWRRTADRPAPQRPQRCTALCGSCGRRRRQLKHGKMQPVLCSVTRHL